MYALCYFINDFDAGLGSKAKAKAILERKTTREVIFGGFKWYIKAAENPTTSDNNQKGKKEV
jgi:hypothetical protein